MHIILSHFDLPLILDYLFFYQKDRQTIIWSRSQVLFGNWSNQKKIRLENNKNYLLRLCHRQTTI